MVTKGVQTKQKIINKSLQLFSVKGYYNTSINDILEATNLTKGGLYGHFKSKEDIWYAVYGQAVTIWKDIVFKDIRKIDDPLKRIEKALDNDLQNYLGADVFEGGCFFLNMLVELTGQSNTMGNCILKGIIGFSEVITLWLKEAYEKNMLKPGLNFNEIAKFIVVSINGCAALYPSTRDPEIWKLTLRQIKYYINGLKI
ncbi:MAG: TetR/AcrR family transcriptional regulator [Deltaproteobacteria bacterium]|nr:TetR/AcrR family transcriptional regulator [Deltaproteobacteria bacterium]